MKSDREHYVVLKTQIRLTRLPSHQILALRETSRDVGRMWRVHREAASGGPVPWEALSQDFPPRDYPSEVLCPGSDV